MSLEERYASLDEARDRALKLVREANSAFTVAAVAVIRVQLLLLAEKHPQITSYSFDANFEYDDEGSYFYVGNLFVSIGDRRLDYDAEGDEMEIAESADEIGRELDEHVAEELFGDKWEGALSVEELRQQEGGGDG